MNLMFNKAINPQETAYLIENRYVVTWLRLSDTTSGNATLRALFLNGEHHGPEKEFPEPW